MVRLRISYHTTTNLFRRYYGRRCDHCGHFSVSVDGSPPQWPWESTKWTLNQQMLWSNTTLGPGRHTVNITHDDSKDMMISLDFFRLVIVDVRG